MASALIEELKTVTAEAKRSQIEDAVGIMGSLSGGRVHSRKRDRNSTGQSGSRRRRRGRGGGERGGVGVGVLNSENNGRIRWQPSLLIGRLS